MHASISAGSYAGLTVRSATLTLIGVSEPPVIDRTGAFSFPPGSLHFALAAVVGDVPLTVTRTNATAARGRVSHGADVFEVTDLRLAYEDAGFGAELRLDLVASHTNRAPQAAIRRIDNPLDCERLFTEVEPDVLVVDIEMPVLDGPSLIKLIHRKRLHRCVALLFSDRSHAELTATIRACEADGGAKKTPDCGALISLIDSKLAKRRRN